MAKRDYWFQVAFGSVPADYNTTAGNIEQAGDFIRVVNSLNQDVELQVRPMPAGGSITGVNSVDNVVIKAGDTYTRPMMHSGGVFVRHRGTAPTSGNIFVNSWSFMP